ncbi:MAG: 6-carboxytetrahydropterin synthase QueD [bacterium]
MEDMMYKLMVSAGFAAAHQLRGYGGKCEDLHGHNWQVQLYVRADDLNEIGLAVDFKEMKGCLRTILQSLDHRYLNDLSPFQTCNPSSENIARYIYGQASERFKGSKVRVDSVRVWESENAYAEFSEELPSLQ